MPMLSQYKPEQRHFILFVGPSGDGKSTAAHSFAQGKKSFEMDFDMRLEGIAGSAAQGIIDGTNIEYDQYPISKGWGPVEKKCNEWDMQVLTRNFNINTISVGSLGAVTRMLIKFSHEFQGGRVLGEKGKDGKPGDNALRVSGPADFNLESTGTHQFFDHLRGYPCNVIISAHIVDRYGKPKPTADMNEAERAAAQFAPNEVVGSKLAVRDNLGANVVTYFNNIFQFSREIRGTQTRFYVEFANDLARNTYGIPPGVHDITGKAFYPFFMEQVEKNKKKAVTP